MKNFFIPFALVLMASHHENANAQNNLIINADEYFEMPGINVMVYHDYYPGGHQGGVTLIQNGVRVAANGDIRLSPRGRPYPDHGARVVDRANNEIAVPVYYADSLKDKYPDLRFPYPDINMMATVRVRPEGSAFRISVDLDQPLPPAWFGKVNFDLELFPGQYFGKPYYMDNTPGIFPHQYNGPVDMTDENEILAHPMASGKRLVLIPGDKDQAITIEAVDGTLELIDGRAQSNNGWFVVRSMLKGDATDHAMEWIVTPAHIPNYAYTPVMHVSQVGYLSKQPKFAVLELDKTMNSAPVMTLERIGEDGTYKTVKMEAPKMWGKFLRYNYARFDFSEIKSPGMYRLKCDEMVSNPFMITDNVFDRGVWQPTLEYYLPAQMCHMRINDRVKVWHGLCHNDDALMAPTSHIHFDGYRQGPATLTKFKPYDPVPGLNVGGWHDAGDYDLRVESQANTTRMLAFMWELFHITYDETTVDQENKVVEIHRPDGVPDILQQIEQGALTVIGGYKSLGRLYRGIICQTGRQYSLLGDGSTMTDNLSYDASLAEKERTGTQSGLNDDRLVFTEENPRRELYVAACLATTYRSLKGYRDALAGDCLTAARELFAANEQSNLPELVDAAVELFRSTGTESYRTFLLTHKALIVDNIQRTAPAVARFMPFTKNKAFLRDIGKALQAYSEEVSKETSSTPFGVRYRPNIWGDGWTIQSFGVNQYFLHKAFPDMFPADAVYNSLNFVLGVHPGENTASFVSGVGVNSLLVAYGFNRDDWSYIPGGSASGTALIRPDLPELKVWPYLWQQTEYVMGGGATNYMFLVLAVREICLN